MNAVTTTEARAVQTAAMGQQITLGTVARIAITDGPPMLKSENARPSGWVYVDVRGDGDGAVTVAVRDSRRLCADAQATYMTVDWQGFVAKSCIESRVVVPSG